MNTRGAVAGSPATVLAALVVCMVCTVCAAAAAVTPGPAAVEVAALTTTDAASEGRGHFKKMMLNPYMLIPQLIALGFAPIVLANLKMMVMSALMINNMALNAAIFMTVRNMVFGPRPKVKYVNYGYGEHHHGDGGHHHDHHGKHAKRSQQQQQSTSEDETQSTAEADDQLRRSSRRGKRAS